jgi:hypothetical protein
MARNNPVAICTIRQSPKRDPKFHHVERLEGAGRSTKAPLAILKRGCWSRIGLYIKFYGFVRGPDLIW